jgi:putative hemolysin
MGTKKLEYWQRDSYLKKGALAKTDIQKSVLRQGIDIGRKQTYEEVLKEIKKYKLFWKGQKDTFNFSKEMRFNLMHQLDLIEKYLKQKIKVASK